MKVNNIENSSNKTSFGWIIPLNNAEKKCGLQTWRFPYKLHGMSKYDVFIKPLSTKTKRERDVGCWGPIIFVNTGFLGGLGSVFCANEFISDALLHLPIDSGYRILIGISAAIIGGLGSINAIMFKKYNDFSLQAATLRGDKNEGDPTPAGIITKEYTVKNDNNRYNPPIDFVKEIEELKLRKFNDFIKHYDTNDLFEPKNYVRILKNRPSELGDEFFNYKIDDKGNTLLTAFFDVVPDDELYPKIIEYLKRQKNLDFNQRDENGISCIEKVFISENKEALDLIINTKYTHDFKRPYCWDIGPHYTEVQRIYNKPVHNPAEIPYSPELDSVYANLQDKEFKKMVDDNVKWDFSDWIAVINSHNVSKAETLKKRFNSPLLDKQKLYNDINNALSNCNDMNFITYMQTNFLKELMKTSTPLQGGG